MSKQVTPPPPGDKPTGSNPPPPPPAWRHWLLPVGLLVAFFLWLALPAIHGTQPTSLTYSQFQSDVLAHKVKTVDIPQQQRRQQRHADQRDELHRGRPVPAQPGHCWMTCRRRTSRPRLRAVERLRLRGADLADPAAAARCSSSTSGRRLSARRGRASCRECSAWASPGPRSSTPSGRTPPSPTWPATRGPRRRSAEVVDFLQQPERYTPGRGGSARAACSWSGRPAPARRCWPGPWPARPRCPSSPSPARALSRCSSGVGAARVRDLFAEARKRGAGDHLHRRDRRHRPAPGRVRRGGLQRRAGADPQPAAGRDGRLRPGDGHRGARGHQPARGPRPGPAAPRPVRPPGHDPAAERQPSGRRSWPCTAGASSWPPTWTSSAIARGTPGFSGADLANLANEAAIFAVRDGRDVHRPPATSTTPGTGSSSAAGRAPTCCCPRRSTRWPCTRPGHALVAALSDARRPGGQGDDPARRARRSASPSSCPLVERHLYGEDYLHDSLAVRLGGRAAELVVLGQGSTGAANDLAGATDLATKMVREFGLSTALGPVGYPEGGSVFLGGGGPACPAARSPRPPRPHRPRGVPAAAGGRGAGGRAAAATTGTSSTAGGAAAGARDRRWFRCLPARGPA